MWTVSLLLWDWDWLSVVLDWEQGWYLRKLATTGDWLHRTRVVGRWMDELGVLNPVEYLLPFKIRCFDWFPVDLESLINDSTNHKVGRSEVLVFKFQDQVFNHIYFIYFLPWGFWMPSITEIESWDLDDIWICFTWFSYLNNRSFRHP